MSIEQLIKDINKKAKYTIISEGLVNKGVPRIPFSSPRLNYMTYGGVPVRRITEFSGDEGSGKTTSALDIVGMAQRMFPQKKVVYFDCEHTLDEDWATLLGVDVKALLLVRPDTETAEQIFEMVLDIIETGEVSLVVLDSLGVLVSAQAYNKTIEERTYGGISQPLSTFSNKLVPFLSKYDCTFIGINQMRDDMNSQYGGQKTTGGHAWKHMCSMRIEYRKSDFIDAEGKSLTRSCENPAGNLVRVHLIKSKVCRQDRKLSFFTLNYIEGIDYVLDTIDVAIKYNLIVQSSTWFKVVDPETGELKQINGKPLQFQGKQRLKQFLLENAELFDEITEILDNKFIEKS